MKTKYLYAIGIALAVAVIIVAGVKHFVPSAVSESTSITTFFSETFCTVSSTIELTTELFSETKVTKPSSSSTVTQSVTTKKTTKPENITTKKEETSSSTTVYQLSMPELKIPTLPFPTTSAASTTSTTTTSENKEVDLSCFDNTAFVGNSRFISFKNYGLAKNVYPVVGLNVDTVFTKSVAGSNVPVIDELNGNDFDKVILLFGDNECGWPNTDVFISRYAKVVAAVRDRVPNAEIYIHAILPVSTEASKKNEFGVNNDRIRQVNEKIKQLTVDEGIHFIEQPACLMDSTNALISEAASDGIHLNKKYSEIWIKDLAVTIF